MYDPLNVHLTREDLERLPAEMSESCALVLLHQIAVCPECNEVGGWVLDLYRSGHLRIPFSAVDLALAKSRAEAPALWAELQPYRFEDQYSSIRVQSRFLSWGLCELLCRESLRTGASDASRAVELAELAVLIADLLKEEEPSRLRWLFQLRSYTWAHVGNARRVLGDLRNSDEAFSISGPWWEAGEAGIGDVLGYEPLILELQASLRIAQRRLPEALELLDRAYSIYVQARHPEHRDSHLSGRVLLSKALAVAEMGDPEQSIALLSEAGFQVDPERDLRLVLVLQHNLLWNLTTVGRYSEAKALLREVWSLCRELGNHLDLLRLRWAEGRIAAGLGHMDEAIRTFQELRQEFALRGIAYDAALVSLEIAALHAEEGRTAEVKELALEMVEIFRSQNVPRETLAAVLAFQRAAARRRATARFAREIGAFLEKARYAPGLEFKRGRR